MKTDTKQSSNLAECGNKSKPLLANRLSGSKNLFLDDKRMPSDAYIEKLWDNPHNIYIDLEWEVVENHNQFKDYVELNGLPDIISFDHDLVPAHYVPRHLWNDYEKSKEWQDNQKKCQPTGAGVALWLIGYCKKNKLELPICYCHSANPVGRDKILKYLSDYISLQTTS